MRRFAIAALILLAAASFAAPAGADSNVFLKFTAGGSYPFMKNLNDELKAQGRCDLTTGLSASVSVGRLFAGRKWGAELWFDVSRYQSFKY